MPDDAIAQAVSFAASTSPEQHETVAKMLAEGRVPANARAAGGMYDTWTILHSAAKSGNERLVQQLLQMGAVVDAQNKKGDTALRVAVSRGHANIAGHLMMAGADPTVVNASGMSAMSSVTAEVPNAAQLAEMIQQAMNAPQLAQVREAAKAAAAAGGCAAASKGPKPYDGGGGRFLGDTSTDDSPQVDMYEEKQREILMLSGSSVNVAPTPSGYGGARQGGAAAAGRDSDWMCPSCGASVFASRSVCFRCQTPKPDPFARGAPDPASEVAIFGEPKPAGAAAAANLGLYDSITANVSGRDAPAAATDFATLNLPEPLPYNLARAGYTHPTPIQRHAIPAVLLGRDVLASAQTGSGQTCAVLLPPVSRLIHSAQALPPHNRQLATPSALVLSPTRELTLQIYGEACKVCYRSGIRPVVCYGGAPIVEQLRELERGCGLLVGTPGRVSDLMERRRLAVGHVAVLILDEADRMLDMGFEPQIRKIAQQADMPQPPSRQTLLFSATFPRPSCSWRASLGTTMST